MRIDVGVGSSLNEVRVLSGTDGGGIFPSAATKDLCAYLAFEDEFTCLNVATQLLTSLSTMYSRCCPIPGLLGSQELFS